MREFLTRTLSGAVYAGIMIASVLIHPLVFLAVFLTVMVLSLTEFYKLSQLSGAKILFAAGTVAGALIFLATFLVHYPGLDKEVLMLIPAAGLVLIVLPMFLRGEDPLRNASLVILGLVYAGVPIALFNELAFHPYAEGFDYQVILFMFLVIWINDSGAYIFGILFGKHKMAPRISPKKSWEGLAGGLAAAFAGTWLSRPLFPDIPMLHLWILCGVIVIAGTMGDLAESAWKRAAGVKDSGNLIPGHGGMLDRFDSLILASPAVYLTINLLK